MKRSGRSLRTASRLIFWTLVLLLAVLAAGVTAVFISKLIVAVSGALYYVGVGLVSAWVVFSLATLCFFRDPNPIPPSIPNAVVAAAHGRVDTLDEVAESEFMGGPCQRISIRLSLWDVHVQYAPARGRVAQVKHYPGQFRPATRPQTAPSNENLLVGLEPADYPGQKLAVRLIAGFLARRIEAFVETGQTVERSERIGLIRYGSRCEMYLPRTVKVLIKLGEKVKGGETIVASFD